MRVSISFVLAVCAPLLALAAPISLNPPTDVDKPRAEAKVFPNHNWKRDDVHTDAYTGQEWKREDGVHADAYTGQGWKRDLPPAEDYPNHGWKRDLPPAEDFPNHGWKRQGGSASVAGGPGGFNKGWKA